MRVLIFFLLCCVSGIPLAAQQQAVIRLADVNAAYKPLHYHITKVQDTRAETGLLGKLSDGEVTLDGGVAPAIQEFIMRNVVQDKTTLPITMQLTRFEVVEKQVGKKRQFDLNMTIAYYSGNTKLVEYNGNAYTQSLGEAGPYIEKMVRENIAGNMRDFDSWMAKNKDELSAEPVIDVTVVLANTTNKDGHIAYSLSRKLTIADFKATPDEASYGAAATMSGISMEIDGSTLRNVTKVKVTVYVYFDRTRSWMKEHGKNKQVLAHEQRHFDITALKACELKQRIQQSAFTPDGYQQELRALLRKVEDEGSDMQNSYDRESEHGTIAPQQQAWNERIATLLQQQSCY